MKSPSKSNRIVTEAHLAREALLRGDAAEAWDRVSRIQEVDFASIRIVRGECLYTLGRVDESIVEFREAVRLSPNSPRPIILLELATSLSALEHATRPPATFGLLFGATESREQVPAKAPDLEALAHELIRKGGSSEPVASEPVSSERVSSEMAEALPMPEIPEEAEPEGVVSETLAAIMAKQGKIEEARKMYIQLSRLHPNKFDYYRQRMKDLDESAGTA